MRTIIALHGNPGDPQDWATLFAQLDKANFELQAFDAYEDDWIEATQRGEDKKILLAHSWGCYRVLKSLVQVHKHVHAVILVSPVLTPAKKTSGLTRFFTKMPILSWLYTFVEKEKTSTLLLRTLAFPRKAEDIPYFTQLSARVRDWKVLLKAARKNIELELKPWSEADVINTVPVIAIFGEKDKFSDPVPQQDILRKYLLNKRIVVPDAGHGLLWTHPETILQAIEQN